jgi:Tol biopolymer transport system component
VVVHDVGRSDGVAFIAMELVRGESLRERMSAGALPPRRMLALAAQIAEGLAGAHAAGITHRDLKPENVMVSSDGHVKILDFGLAKLVPSQGDPTSAPTAAMESPRTQSGVVLGTVGYMSPEQAAGRPVDYPSDQFSLGSILYEMATGRRAFQRESAAQTLAAIIEDEPPPLSVSKPDLPTPLVWLIERCLAKSPSERYESTRDLARELANLRDRIAGGSAQVAIAAPRRWPALAMATMGWAAAGLLLVALAAILVARRSEGGGGGDRLRVQFQLEPPQGTNFHSGEISTNTAVSPDGRTLAVVAWLGGRSAVSLRPIGSLSYRPLAGTEGAASPFWSPDSRLLAFFEGGKLKKIDFTGGPPRTICDVAFEGTGTWNEKGDILFAQAGPRAGIFRVRADGGEPSRLTTPEKQGREFHFWPRFLPDGRHFLYIRIVVDPDSTHELRVGSLDSKETSSLGRLDSRVEYAPDGFLLFAGDGALLARPFDAGNRRWSGEPFAVVERLHTFWTPANAGFSVSGNGVLAYEQGSVPSRVVWLDRVGREVSSVTSTDQVNHLRLAPDGSRAAIDVIDPRTGTADLWVFDTARGVSLRLTSDPIDEKSAVWWPDGRRLLFKSDRYGPPDIWEMAADGGSAKPLLELPGVETPQDLSSDGKLLLFTQADRTTGLDIWILSVESREAVAFRHSRFTEDEPRFSPDGNWIAYDSDESGSSEVYVAPRGKSGGTIRVSRDGGFSPRWRRDGRELFFLAPGRRLMAAPVKISESLEVGSPAELFRAGKPVLAFDAAPDGQRFLVSEMANPPAPPITVVVNWPPPFSENQKPKP